MGSTSSRDHPAHRVWLVRLSVRTRHAVVALGLTREGAEQLASRLRYVLAIEDEQTGDTPTGDAGQTPVHVP